MITIIELDECESTNDEAWKYAPQTTLVVAHRQTRGRGRQGRSWASGLYGNVMVSLAVAPPEKHLTWMPLAAGVAAVEALEQTCSLVNQPLDPRIRLKWPNDILFEDCKMGGVLSESRVIGERANALVIGLGLNFIEAPKIEGIKTASLLENTLNTNLSSTQVSAMRWFFIREWATKLLAWNRELSAGNAQLLRDTWLNRAKLDQYPDLTVHDRKGTLVQLHALGLDGDGRLRARISNSKIIVLDQPDSIAL